jgi:DNA-binding transcriptional ArsR family regulator
MFGFFKRWSAATRRQRILDWMRADPGWHYGLDLVKAGLASRSTIYIHLAKLQDLGLVEFRWETPVRPGVVRPQYRAKELQEIDT